MLLLGRKLLSSFCWLREQREKEGTGITCYSKSNRGAYIGCSILLPHEKGKGEI
jgi:hypothetical protein